MTFIANKAPAMEMFLVNAMLQTGVLSFAKLLATNPLLSAKGNGQGTNKNTGALHCAHHVGMLQ